MGRLSGARRSLLDALAHISGRRMFGDTALLRRLCPGQAEELFRYADAVISTGSGLSSLNRILSYILDARSITVMRPNTAASRFDLIIVPEHDRVHGRSSVCRINGALVAQPSSGEYEQAGRLLRETFGLDAGERHAGVLIGGPVADGAYDERGAVVFLEAAAAAARAQGLRLLVTTSRRTPAAIESAVERIFATEPVCVIANRRNYPFAVRGIFACAHRVLVSADSVSMITESATSCDTGVCDLFNAAGATKHGRFVDRLVADGYAAAVTAGSVDGFLKDDRCFKRIDNESRVCEVLKRVLE